jgi:hypothetical protein
MSSIEKKTKSLATSVQDVDSKGLVTIQITQFDKYDSDNDRLLKGALNKTWKDGSQVHLVDHKMGTSTYVGLPVSKDAETGIIVSKINLNKQVGKDLFEDYKFSQENGRSLQHSHGFQVMKDKAVKNEKGGYDFKEIKQFEYSTVLFGAVSETPLIGLKSKGSLNSLIIELEERLKVCSYSDEYGKLLENKVKELKSMLNEPLQDTQEEEHKKQLLIKII